MPFGIRNAARTFQHFMDQVLRGVHFCYDYIDDLLIASPNTEEHKHLRSVFEQLQDHGVVSNPAKCELGVTLLQFLGHQIDSHGIRPLEDKVRVVREFPQPTTQCKLHVFLGFVSFYYRFLPHAAHTLQPLHRLFTDMRDGTTGLCWTTGATTAFANIKQALANATLLSYPKPVAPMTIMCDASNTAVGAVLQQHIGQQWCPIAYCSKKLKPAETHYKTFDLEVLAIYLAIKHSRHFVEGHKFQVLTDLKPLTHALLSSPERYTPRQV